MASIKSMVNGSGCPECAKNKRKISQRNHYINTKESFANNYPSLLNEWDFKRNININPDDYSYGSRKVVWWKCKKGHNWKASIGTRCKGIGCPECAKEMHTSFPEKAILFYVNQCNFEIMSNYKPNFLHGLELDIYIPSLLCAVEYDGQRWHKDIKKDIRKNNLCKNNNIRLIRIREPECPLLDGECIVLDTLSYESLTKAIQILFHKLCLIGDIDVIRDEVLINNLIEYQEKQKSFAYKFPILAKEWNYKKNGNLKPTHVTPYSNKTVWWLGKCGHEWQMKVSSRALGQRCPICTNKRVVSGINDLETLNENLLKEWNHKKNTDVLPSSVSLGSHKIVWWKCSKCGHVWEAAIRDRVKGHKKCPNCIKLNKQFDYYKINNQIIKASKNGNTIEKKCPELVAEWHHRLNGVYTPSNVAPNSNIKFWWICSKGHEYLATPLDRKYGCGCPYCSGRKHKKLKCLENNKIYEKFVDAERDLNIPKGRVLSMFKRNGKSCCGYHFQFVSE